MNCNVKKGNMLYRYKGLVRHLGVCIGNGLVLHNSPIKGVEAVSYGEFSAGQDVQVVRKSIVNEQEFDDRVHEVQNKENSYQLIYNNCEHIANYLVSGEKKSPQVKAVILGATAGLCSSNKNQILMMTIGALMGLCIQNMISK